MGRGAGPASQSCKAWLFFLRTLFFVLQSLPSVASSVAQKVLERGRTGRPSFLPCWGKPFVWEVAGDPVLVLPGAPFPTTAKQCLQHPHPWDPRNPPRRGPWGRAGSSSFREMAQLERAGVLCGEWRGEGSVAGSPAQHGGRHPRTSCPQAGWKVVRGPAPHSYPWAPRAHTMGSACP